MNEEPIMSESSSESAASTGPGDRPRAGRLADVGRPALALTAIGAALMLAGCFGGDGDGDSGVPGDPKPASVPDSALGSSTAYTQFTLTTSQSSSETAEPLTADNVTTPPASETDEPASVT
jgi:hypothetical protein